MRFSLKQKKRSAVSPVIATLLLIAIAVAAAIIVYAFVTGLIGGLSNGANSSLVPVTGSLTVPSGSGPGLLVVSVQNTANNPITGIQVAWTNMEDITVPTVFCMGEGPGVGVGCNAVATSLAACGANSAVVGPPKGSVPFCNNANAVIATANPLQVGGQTSASENVQGNGVTLQSGTSYSMTVTVDFSNGSTQSQPVSVTAQI